MIFVALAATFAESVAALECLPAEGRERVEFIGEVPRGEVHQGVEEGPPPVLAGDAILLGIEGSSSVLVYWDGTRFHAYWQGD